MKRISILIFSLLLLTTSFGFAKVGDRIRTLPVQDSGRVKPFDTFAKETLELVYGKSSYKAYGNHKVDAHWVILTWMLSPESWIGQPIFEITNHEVMEKLGLPKDRKTFSGDEAFKTESFSNLMQELSNKRESKEKLTPYFQALQRLENQFFIFSEIATGKMLRVIPPKSDQDTTTWGAVADLPQDLQAPFVEVSKNVAGFLGLQAQESSKDSKNNNSAEVLAAGQKLDDSVVRFEELARAVNPVVYEQASKVNIELLYNDIHPFRWAYVFYLIGVLVLLFIWIRKSDKNMWIAWTFISVGFVIHTLGFLLRVYLAERAPVSNMYETVIWTSWGAVLFAMILEFYYKFRIVLLAGALVGLFALVVADYAPAVLDPSIQPLDAVLRSSYWLVIHVMTITISYAAFLLAMGLGDIALIYYAMGEKKHSETINHLITAIYRAMQIGVAFLAPGIILGGVWADYSWGRFWGWDPKETWALIVLLGYIIVLHARLVGWLKNFGMAAAGIITFSLVIMAWYGVNFVLGAGLHSYGFGAGGVEYVTAFVVLQFLFVGYVYLKRLVGAQTQA